MREGTRTEAVAPRPASTILLLRDSAGPTVTSGEIEVFMMVRHYEIDFNSGALVFPGGSVDKGDQEIIARPELYSGGEGARCSRPEFRIAAIRETFEESGILLARPRGSKALVDAKRAGEIEAASRAALCESKTTFLKVLTDNGMMLALDELVPYAHWITPEGMPKRFDTWFFLAAAPPEQAGAHDGKESTDSIWVSPREALAGDVSRRFKLPFPTTRNLIKLGKQKSVTAALDDKQGRVDRDGHTSDDESSNGGRRLLFRAGSAVLSRPVPASVDSRMLRGAPLFRWCLGHRASCRVGPGSAEQRYTLHRVRAGNI